MRERGEGRKRGRGEGREGGKGEGGGVNMERGERRGR